jgi:tRNA(fMet)-specific endonuclease VapC
MARYLLDADVVIDWLLGFPSSVALVTDLHERGESLCTSAVVIAEIHSGVRTAEIGEADNFLESCTYLPTRYEDARQAGRWRYDFARRGIALSTTDMLLAATAYAHQATIVTGNVKDYPMEGVTVLPLPRARR